MDSHTTVFLLSAFILQAQSVAVYRRSDAKVYMRHMLGLKHLNELKKYRAARAGDNTIVVRLFLYNVIRLAQCIMARRVHNFDSKFVASEDAFYKLTLSL